MSHRLPSAVWVVVPAYNEAHHLELVLPQILHQTANVICVDDGSSDLTADVARRYAPHVLVHAVNLGKGAALKTGCDFAFEQQGASAVVVMDADGQHDPAELPKFLAALQRGSQIVLGVRELDEHMSWPRRLWNLSVSQLIHLFFGAYFQDIPCGYKAFSRQVYPQLRWQVTDYAVEMELAARIGKFHLPYTTVPIRTIYLDTKRGMTGLQVLRMMGHIVNWRWSL